MKAVNFPGSLYFSMMSTVFCQADVTHFSSINGFGLLRATLHHIVPPVDARVGQELRVVRLHPLNAAHTVTVIGHSNPALRSLQPCHLARVGRDRFAASKADCSCR